MEKIILYHGSENIIKEPQLKLGRKTNDYGQGFYCSENLELAKEWATKNNKDGYVNVYEFDMSSLNVLDLHDGSYNVLHWIALLTNYRLFDVDSLTGRDAKKFLKNNFLIDLSSYDVVIGYRADDSYFSYAKSFIDNSIPLRILSKALVLGKLGKQVALISDKAFSHIKYIRSEPVNKDEYFKKYYARDIKAREDFVKLRDNLHILKSDIFISNFLQGTVDINDERLQQNILK